MCGRTVVGWCLVGYRCGGLLGGCTLVDGLVTFGAGVVGTLGARLGVGVNFDGGWTASAKMCASWHNASSCAEPKVANSAAGAGCCSTWMRSLAAKMAASALEVLGFV